MVRAGQYTGSIGKPSKVALLGFSFGSYTTHNVVAAQPNLADAVILTGIGFNSTGLDLNGLVRSFVPRIAALQNPALYGDRDSGYWTWRDGFTQIYKLGLSIRYTEPWLTASSSYFRYPNYSPDIAVWAEVVKQPFSVSEFLTFATFETTPISYTGPALVSFLNP